MRFILNILFITFLLGNCKNNTEQVNNPQSLVLNSSDTTINFKIELLKLNSEISKKLKEVPSYTLLHQEIDSIRQVPLNEVSQLVSQVNHNIIELKNSLPVELKNKPILSRLGQLKTYSLLLEDTFLNTPEDVDALKETVIQLLESYNLVVIQLNEAGNKIPEDFQKELEKEAFKRDSLKQNEVAPLF